MVLFYFPVFSVSFDDIVHSNYSTRVLCLKLVSDIIQLRVIALLQMAGYCCGTGSSLSGPRELPWPVLLYREAPKVLPDWCSFGGGCPYIGTLHYNTSKLLNTVSAE